MAVSVSEDTDEIITQINVVPLVDIILVVLIIFMITANLIAKQSIEVNLPEAATGEGTEPTTLGLMLTAGGDLYLNGAPTDEEALAEYLPTVLEADPKAQAVIAADQAVPHGNVIRLIDFIRQHGIYKFALNIDPIPADFDPTAGVQEGTATP